MNKEAVNLKQLQRTNCFFLVILVVGSYFLFSWDFAWSALAGGLISIISFQVAHTDVLGFIESLTERADGLDEKQTKQEIKLGKQGFMFKFWIRIVIIGVVLLLLIKSGQVNIFGLILGLSTVVFTITFTAFNVARHYFIRRR